MNKTKSKVLSLVLASAMIVSSFSSLNFASAATKSEAATVKFTGSKLVDNTLYLASDSTAVTSASLSTLLGTVDLETYDGELVSADYVDYSLASGKRLASIDKDDEELDLRADVSGEQEIVLKYEADYERDDKDVTLKGTKKIKLVVDEEASHFVADFGANLTAGAEKPEITSAAVNDKYKDLAVYTVSQNTTNPILADYTTVDPSTLYTKTVETSKKAVDSDTLKLKTTKTFDTVLVKSVDATGTVTADVPTGNEIRLVSDKFADADYTTSGSEKAAKLGAVATDTLQIKLPEGAGLDSDFTDYKPSVAKKWNLDVDLDGSGTATVSATQTVNKKGSSTYISTQNYNFDDDYKDAVKKLSFYSVSGYELVSATTVTTLSVEGGTVGNIDLDNAAAAVTVEKGTVGDVDAYDVTVEDGSVGTIDASHQVDVTNGKVKAIDSEDATIYINGGSVTGDVEGDTVNIDADDDDVNTVIGGKVIADNATPTINVAASTDATVEVKGALIGEVTVSDDAIVGVIDADYEYPVVFDDFTGTVKSVINAADSAVSLINDSKVVLSAALTADSVDVAEDTRLQVPEARVNSIDGEGTFAFPAGKLFIEDTLGDTVLEITDGLVVGATAFQSYEGQIDGEDVNGLGYTLETKAANSDIDKQVIKTTTFAGVKLDKSELSIAKDFSATVAVANYPAGTALPEGASIEWTLDTDYVGNDNFILTTEGNVATIKVLDYNTDDAAYNKATVTATVVDEDGYALEDYSSASVRVTALAKPASTVTLDTTKPVTVGTGAVYQYIAKSSTGAVLSASSSDTQIATVELFNAADPRGYKFQVKGVAVGTATITTTDANGATATLTVNVTKVEGTLKADTTTYTFAPGAIYDVKFSTTGTTAVPVVTVNGKVVSIAPRGNGVYRVTAQNPGTAFVVATVGNTHVSVKFVVANGAASVGVKGNNVSTLK